MSVIDTIHRHGNPATPGAVFYRDYLEFKNPYTEQMDCVYLYCLSDDSGKGATYDRHMRSVNLYVQVNNPKLNNEYTKNTIKDSLIHEISHYIDDSIKPLDISDNYNNTMNKKPKEWTEEDDEIHAIEPIEVKAYQTEIAYAIKNGIKEGKTDINNIKKWLRSHLNEFPKDRGLSATDIFGDIDVDTKVLNFWRKHKELDAELKLKVYGLLHKNGLI